MSSISSPVAAKVAVKSVEDEAPFDLSALTGQAPVAPVAAPVVAPIAPRASSIAPAAVTDAVSASAPTAAGAVTVDTKATASQGLSKLRQGVLELVEKQGLTAKAKEYGAAKIKADDQYGLTNFGSDAMNTVGAQATKMLDGVRMSDAGQVGESLSQLNGQMKGFDMRIHEKANGLVSWFSDKKKLVEAAIEEFKVRERTVNAQLDKISDGLFDKQTKLAEQVGQLEVEFTTALAAMHGIEFYMAAGIYRMQDIQENVLPQLRADSDANPEDKALLQKVADTEKTVQAIDRRLGEFAQTRVFLGQQLPTIRMAQDLNNQLIGRINTINTIGIGMFRMLAAQTIIIATQKDAMTSANDFVDNMNTMLVQSATNLHQNSVELQQQIEKGIMSYDALDQANQQIIASVTEVQAIAKQAIDARKAAEDKLDAGQKQLAAALRATAS